MYKKTKKTRGVRVEKQSKYIECRSSLAFHCTGKFHQDLSAAATNNCDAFKKPLYKTENKLYFLIILWDENNDLLVVTAMAIFTTVSFSWPVQPVVNIAKSHRNYTVNLHGKK